MSYTVQRILSFRLSKIRGFTNIGNKALISQGFADGGLSLHSSKCDIQVNSRCHHTGCFENKSSFNLAAIFNSSKLNIVDRPLVRDRFIIDPSIISNLDISDKPKNEKVIEEPVQPNAVEKRAEKMIGIRKRKMKKHKLKKLRKRMKFEWKKKAQRREKIREKAFLAELIGQIKTAEGFSPEKYAEEQRRILKQTFLPWKYEEMPQWYLQQVMENDKRLEREKKEDEERDKLLAEFNKTYKIKGSQS